MITLTGTLRQSGNMTFEGKTKAKLWIEHTTERDNGPADLKLEELFLDGVDAATLPPAGSQISLVVRPYASGKSVKFQAVSLVTGKPQKAA